MIIAAIVYAAQYKYCPMLYNFAGADLVSAFNNLDKHKIHQIEVVIQNSWQLFLFISRKQSVSCFRTYRFGV